MCPDSQSALPRRPLLEEVNLVGELIVLRPIRPDDAIRAFRAIDGQDEILRWSCWAGPESEERLREGYSIWRKDTEFTSDYQFAICEVKSNRLVGVITLSFSGHPEQGDVGYWIDVGDWGRGFGTEAVELVTYLAFHYGLARVLYGWVFVGNEGSKRVLEKSGYTLEYTTKNRVERLGQEVAQWYLLQTSSDWLKRLGGWRPQAEKVRLSKFDREKA